MRLQWLHGKRAAQRIVQSSLLSLLRLLRVVQEASARHCIVREVISGAARLPRNQPSPLDTHTHTPSPCFSIHELGLNLQIEGGLINLHVIRYGHIGATAARYASLRSDCDLRAGLQPLACRCVL